MSPPDQKNRVEAIENIMKNVLPLFMKFMIFTKTITQIQKWNVHEDSFIERKEEPAIISKPYLRVYIIYKWYTVIVDISKWVKEMELCLCVASISNKTSSIL